MNHANLPTHTMEDSYFNREDQMLIDNLRQLQQMERTRESLKSVSGISDPKTLDRLIELEIHPETLSSLAVIPLIAVAWADGEVDAKERSAILKALEHESFAKGIDLKLVGHWLETKPKAELLEGWLTYSKALAAELTAEQKTTMRTELVGHARQVAEASGGVLGMGKVSEAEKSVLDKLTNAWL